MDRTQKFRTARLGITSGAGVVAVGVWGELAPGSAESTGFVALMTVLAVATAVAVWKGVPVPAAVVVVPLAVFATVLGVFLLAIAFGESDGQAALVPVVGGIIALLLLPATGAVAGLTLAVRESVRRPEPNS